MRQFRILDAGKGVLNITSAQVQEVAPQEETTTEPVDSRPYKVYSAIFSQSGTAAPEVVVLENTFEGSLLWTRDSVGSYSLNSASTEFTVNTVMFKHIEHAGLNRWIAGRRLSGEVFQLLTYGNSVPTDGINGTDGFPTFIEIRSYPDSGGGGL